VFALSGAEVAYEVGTGSGDFIILVLTRSFMPAQLAGLVFVTMIEEICDLMVGTMVAGVALALYKAISAGDARGAATARLGILLSVAISIAIGAAIILLVLPWLVHISDLGPEATEVVHAAMLPIALSLFASAAHRMLGNLMSAVDHFWGIMLQGIIDGGTGLGTFILLQPALGV